MYLQDNPAQTQISLAYLPPTPRQAWSALAAALVLLLGLAVLAPFANRPLPRINGFIPAVDAIISATDLITAILFLAHFSITRSRALLALACGYLFSAIIVAAHGLSFPGAFSPTGNLGGTSQTTIRLYVFWHIGFPAALFAYVWLRREDLAKASRPRPTSLVASLSVAAVLTLACCIVLLAAAGDRLLPSILVDPVHSGPVVLWLVAMTMVVCAAALSALWLLQHSALDQWLMVVMLASIVELTITAFFGGTRFTVGFYTGRAFSIVTSTLVLTILLAETTKLYGRLARADILASAVKSSQALSGEIELPKLIERLMTIALENAGANRGVLILRERDEYLIQAEARADRNRVEVLRRQQSITGVTCPESLVRHVLRTQEGVILDDASNPNPFSADHYLRDRQSKSILCLPLIRQRDLTGILLLESTLASHAFTEARIAFVELLAAQAAISLENTRLYSDLQERETKVRRLVESNIIGILIGTPDGRILEANQAFLRIVGYEQADLETGRLRVTELTPAEWHDRDAQAFSELTTIGTAQPYEKEYFRKDGSRASVLVGGATFDERGAAVAFVLDLTERKLAEAQARENQRRYREVRLELEHTNRVATVGQLTASIAHEVNQPIAAAATNANTALRWLDMRPPNLEKAQQALGRIIENANRAGEVVAGIRALIKKDPPRQDRLAMNQMILEVIALTEGEAVKNEVSVRTQFAEGLPVVEGNKVQLQQVVLNLIINAVQAMTGVEEGSRELLVSTNEAVSEGVLVAVADSGPGLAPSRLGQLFEAFYTTKSSGLGMGLPICHAIIEAHGGRLWAAANVPRGAVFQFTVPACAVQNVAGN